MPNLPFYIYLVFGLTVLLAIFLFYTATRYSNTFLALASVWIVIQTALSLSGFYTTSSTFPPRIPFILLPPVLTIIILFITKGGKKFIDWLDIKTLTLFHTIRIPIEFVLLWLFMYKAVPQLMTFEGRNFDIFSGLSAPIIYYFGFVKNKLSKPILIAWNLICMALVLNVAANGLLSAPTPIQKFAFDQPNIAILYFPFVLLPALIVPLVIFAHLASIKKLLAVK